MKLYYHPASTTCRTIMLFAAEEGIALDYQLVDLFSGEHLKEHYARVNPSCVLPTLEDGDFRLTESSAILKYLADKFESAAYPKELEARARINEAMDWFNSNFYRDFGYAFVYTQVLPGFQRSTDAAQAEAVAWGKDKSTRWLGVLDRHFLGNQPYVCGAKITIADYFGVELVNAGALIGCRFAEYPNVQRWLQRMKGLQSWPKVHEAFDGFAASLKGKSFVSV
jgi:glutathione S-transferase